jgi:hypothetical protein
LAINAGVTGDGGKHMRDQVNRVLDEMDEIDARRRKRRKRRSGLFYTWDGDFDWSSVFYITVIVLALLVGPSVWLVKSYHESQVYNELTGAETTMWDAMWVQLRVQAPPQQHD